MFDRYGQAARRALFVARSEAARRGQRTIGSEYVLLGILREIPFTIAPHTVEEKLPQAGDDASPSAELRLSDHGRKLCAYAADEAKTRRDDEVTPFHLLLGMLRVTDSRGAAILAEQGIDYARASSFPPEPPPR